jgi:hypothetical protein
MNAEVLYVAGVFLCGMGYFLVGISHLLTR